MKMTIVFDRIARGTLLYLILSLASVSQNTWSSTILDTVSLPAGAVTHWVSPSLIHNGVSYEVQRFVSSDDLDHVLNFYRTRWQEHTVTAGVDASVNTGSEEVPAFVENRVGRWFTISQIRHGFSIVLQLKTAEQGVEGYLSGYRLSNIPETLTDIVDIPVMVGSQVVSRTGDLNDPKNGITQIVTNQASVTATHSFYRDVMPRNGWSLATGSTESSTFVLLYSKSSAQSEISISRGGDATVIVINRTGREHKP